MKRLFSLVDVVVAAIVLFVVVLPPRPVKARRAAGGDDDSRLALAFAQARAHARPDDGALTADYAQRLGEVGFWDWAVQEAAAAAGRKSESPTRWRALRAAAFAHADRLEAKEALDYAQQALSACDRQIKDCEREPGTCMADGKPWCPEIDYARLDLYQRHLDAGVKSGIDPRKNPEKFREAGQAGLRSVHTGNAP